MWQETLNSAGNFTVATNLFGVAAATGIVTLYNTLTANTTSDIGETGARFGKGWLTDLEVTNAPKFGSGTTGQWLQIDGSDIAQWVSIHDSPIDTSTTIPISSNWAFDHNANTTTSHCNMASANTANALVRRDVSGDFIAGTITAALTGNATSADIWSTGRKLTLGTDLTGDVTFDGSGDFTLNASVVNDSHTHSIYYLKTGGTISGNVALSSGSTFKFDTGSTVSIINATFVDNDTSLMTSQAVKEKITSYSYVTGSGAQSYIQQNGLTMGVGSLIRPAGDDFDSLGTVSVAWGNVYSYIFTDRTPICDLETAKQTVNSFTDDGSGKIDHKKMHSFIKSSDEGDVLDEKGKPTGEKKIIYGRNLGASITANMIVLKDLITVNDIQEVRIKKLEDQIKQLLP